MHAVIGYHNGVGLVYLGLVCTFAMWKCNRQSNFESSDKGACAASYELVTEVVGGSLLPESLLSQ